MTKEAIIQKVLSTLNQLPDGKVQEVANFADYVMKRDEEYRVLSGIEKLVEKQWAFQFLNDEDDIYSTEDIKEKY